ncbi:MAG: hypothetical protein ACRDKJ_00060 [Actinomycetota bacterium]
MRNEREEAIRRHPASGVAPAGRSEGRLPYRRFLDALEELELVVSLHGRASVEASLARAEVRRVRDLATEAWRSNAAA